MSIDQIQQWRRVSDLNHRRPRRKWWCIDFFVMFCFNLSRVTCRENPHIKKNEVQKQERCVESRNPQDVREVNLEKKKIELVLTYVICQAKFFFTILLETPPSGPHVPSTLKKRRSPTKLHHIIANEQSSVAVFPVCLGAAISKCALPAAGSLFLRL